MDATAEARLAPVLEVRHMAMDVWRSSEEERYNYY